MIENISSVLEQIKSIRGARFYFVIAVLFLFGIVFLFRSEISNFVNHSTQTKELKLRRVNDVKINNVINSVYDTATCHAYLLYLYQPAEPVIKKLELAVPSTLKNEPEINEFVLHRQKELTTLLQVSRHVLLDAADPTVGTEKYHRINGMFIPYIYIYGIKNTDADVIGEIHIWFKIRPSEDELKLIDSKMSETEWYVYE